MKPAALRVTCPRHSSGTAPKASVAVASSEYHAGLR
jgi:hypothetical protein